MTRRITTPALALAGAALLALPAVASAHRSPGMAAWGQTWAHVGLASALAAHGGVHATTDSRTKGSASHGAAAAHVGAQVDGVLSTPLAVAASASATSAGQQRTHLAGLMVILGGQATVRTAHTITTLASVQTTTTESLTLVGGATYAVAAGATVTMDGRAYTGTMLYPGERIHAALKSGQVVAIQVQSATAWETYRGMSGGTVQLSLAGTGGATFSAALAPAAMVRTASGTTAASSSTLAAGTEVRAVFSAQGQVILLQATGRTKAAASAAGRDAAHAGTQQPSRQGPEHQGGTAASPQGQGAGATHSQAGAHSQGSAHANGHAKGHGGLALGLSASISASASLGTP